MGQSAVDASKAENKMGGSVIDAGALHVSVSFGRFENDSLCWEKWSAFPANKYLEEVEKCSTPGSVAQKAAYFEAHYKNIAARKSTQVDQLKNKVNDPVDSEDRHKTVSVNSSCCVEEGNLAKSSDAEIQANGASTESAADGIDPEEKAFDLTTGSTCSIVVESTDQHNTACKSVDLLSPAVDAKVEFHGSVDDLKSGEAEENVQVKEDALSLGSHECTDGATTIEPYSRATSGQRKKPEKATALMKSSAILATKKKQSAAAIRSPVVSTPRPLKPAVTKPVDDPRPPAEKKDGFSPLTGKKISPAARKGVASPSLHLSLSWGPTNSYPGSLATTRKSLIVEKMGDEDIAQHAFKTFPNKILGQVTSLSVAKSSPTHQPPRKKTLRKSWTSTTHESNEGTNDSIKKMPTLNGQRGSSRMSVISRSLQKGTDSEKCGTTTSPSGMQSHGRADKLKRLSQKPGEEIIAKEADGAILQSEMQMQLQNDVEFKKLKQSFSFKAKPLPAFYRRSGEAKSPACKKDAKSEASG